MIPNTTHVKPKPGRTLVVLAGLVACAAIALLTYNVQRELRSLSSAQSDNVQWSLAQAEVEFLEYTRQTNIYPIDVANMKRRFDVFYSRVSTIREASVFEDLRGREQTADDIEEIWRFLEDSVAIIDLSDAEVIARLPELTALNTDARPVVRSLAKSGLAVFAERSDTQRVAVARTMTQLAVAIATLIGLLGFGIYYLNRLNARIFAREREQALISDRMNTVIATSLDGVIVSDETGNILAFNPAAETIFGHHAKDVIGSEIGDIIVPDHMRDAHNAGMERMRQKGERRVVGKGRVQLEGKRANGDVFPVELALQSAKTDDGEIIVAFLRDISKRVADQAELVSARDKALAGEKMKTSFLATMSHEIRTPLNGLLGNLNLLRDTRISTEQERYISYMESSGRLLMSQISDVLDITRYDAGKLTTKSEPVDLSALLQDIIENQSGTAVENETALSWGWNGPPMNWILSDHDRLQHILINLIGNAVKFTRRGKVNVTAEILPSDAQEVLSIAVSDTGVGISEDLQEQIFEDFVTGQTSRNREVGGTGLGLSIARRFVQALGGEISVESVVGTGSTFRLTLPVTEAIPPVAAKEVVVSDKTTRKLVVLLVEDNEINRVVAREMIEAEGHEVVEARDGREGLNIARSGQFDLIFMDINMPVMDGRSATRAIRAHKGSCATVPIIALTANAIASVQSELLADGMNDVLTKPLSRDALRQVLASVGTDIALVDHRHSADTRDALGEQAYAKLSSRFAQEVETLITWLQAEESRDLLEVGSRCHKVAGSAAVFGAFQLRDLLKSIENAAKTGNAQAVHQNIVTLPDIWGRTKGRL